MKSHNMWLKENCLVLIGIFLAFSQIVICQGTPKSTTSAKPSAYPTRDASAKKPSPNQDLLGSWVPLNRAEDIGLSIEITDDQPYRPCQIWPDQDKTEICSIERRGRAIVFNGSGGDYGSYFSAPNHMLLTVIDGDTLHGVIYPSNIKFILHRQKGNHDTLIYPEAGDALTGDVWSDALTGLMWARRDNGKGITWNEAVTYCNNLRLGGYDSWRLPDINELETLVDGSHPTKVYSTVAIPFELKIKAAIRLSSSTLCIRGNDGSCYDYNFWSNTQGNTHLKRMGIKFYSPGIVTPEELPSELRFAAALCVRRLGG